MQRHYPLNPTTGVEDQTQLPWSNGVPQTGQPGSYPPFQAVVEPMTELANLIDQSGLVETSNDLFQVTRAVRGGQLDFDATDTGTADAILCQVALAHTQLQAGLPFTFIKGPNANSGNVVPTLTITDLSGNNGLTGTIVKSGGGALAKGDLPGSALITVRARAPGVFAVVSLLTISDVLALIASQQQSLQIVGGRVAVLSGSGTWQPGQLGLVAGSNIYVYANGGGGGGGGSYTNNSTTSTGVGGGGGEYAEGAFTLTAADIANGIPYTVASAVPGGLGSNPPTNGTNGQTTSFGGRISAAGGIAGTAGFNNVASGSGTGGSGGTGGSRRLSGGGGGFGPIYNSAACGGGAGGSSPYGGVGNSTNINANGSVGLFPGGGGNGGAASSSSLSGNGAGGSNGGNGAAGTLIIHY